MNLFTSINALLLLAGLIILVLNLGLSAFRVWRGHLQAGLFSVITTLLACVLLVVGLVRITFPALAGAAPKTVATTDILAARIVIIGALVLLVSGLFLFMNERSRAGFEAALSPGLLYVGAGFFALAATLLIPALPGQFSVARASGEVSIVNQGSSNRILPTRVAAQRSAPTAMPTMTATAMDLPTLTPTPEASPTPLFTPVAYAYGDATTPSSCTITARTTLNLRGDPSVQNQAIGQVFAGSLLPVTGRTADKKWWQVINSQGTNQVEGWVSGDYVTVSSACDSAPVIGPTATPTKIPPTPRPSATSKTKSAS